MYEVPYEANWKETGIDFTAIVNYLLKRIKCKYICLSTIKDIEYAMPIPIVYFVNDNGKGLNAMANGKHICFPQLGKFLDSNSCKPSRYAYTFYWPEFSTQYQHIHGKHNEDFFAYALCKELFNVAEKYSIVVRDCDNSHKCFLKKEETIETILIEMELAS